MPSPSDQNADGHAVEEPGPGGFWRGRLAVAVEPDDRGIFRATTAHSSNRSIAISRQHDGENPSFPAGADTLRDLAAELKRGTDLSRIRIFRRDLFTVELDTHPAEQGFQSGLKNPLRAATHAPPAVAGV